MWLMIPQDVAHEGHEVQLPMPATDSAVQVAEEGLWRLY